MNHLRKNLLCKFFERKLLSLRLVFNRKLRQNESFKKEFALQIL